MKTSSKFVLGYCRTSKRKREASAEISIERQQEVITDYCKSNKLGKPMLLVDQRVSGDNPNRPAFLELQRMIEAGQVEALLVYSLDRLVRDLALQSSLVKLLIAKKIKFISISDCVDLTSSSPEGIFQANLHGSLNQLYKDKISQKMRLCWKYKKSKGAKAAGITPYGFNVDQGKLIPNACEQENIQLIKQLRASGFTIQAIIEELQRRGVKTKTGKERFGFRTIQLLLQRPDDYFKIQKEAA